MKFRIAYNEYFASNKLRSYYVITETIEARGIMHAAKLASNHAKELTKILNKGTKDYVRVADISQVTQK